MPRPKAAAARARRDEWELHRRQLSRLFTVDGVPVVEIAKYMKDEHGFDRKPKDYEYRLRKWNLRRNLHENELRFIHSELLRRKQAGRPSEVVVSGSRWSESMIRGRLERHKFPWLSGALATLTYSTTARQMGRPDGQQALLIQMMRPYIAAQPSKTQEPREVTSMHPARKMRAILEVIAPEVHAGDHENAVNILHTGTHESIVLELVRLIIYLETNNMVARFGETIGCYVDFTTCSNMMDFLRNVGFLTEANIKWLRGRNDPTSQTFLDRLMAWSIIDENSLDVLKWLTRGDNSNVNQPLHINDGHFSECYRSNLDPWIPGGVSRLYPLNPKFLLDACCIAGNINAVTLALDLGADPYGTSAQPGRTPLQFAATLRCHERALNIADLLLSKQTTSSPNVRKEAMGSALNLAIAGAHNQLVVRLLSELGRLGHWTICSQHFTIAAMYGDVATIRLLVEQTSRHGDGSVRLPNDILFSAVFRCGEHQMDPDRTLDKVICLLKLGANPSIPSCRHGCTGTFLLDSVLISCRYRGNLLGVAWAEDFILEMLDACQKHGYPLKKPKPSSVGHHQWLGVRMAIGLGYNRLVEKLLDWGAEVDFLMDERGPAIHFCADCKSNDLDGYIQDTPEQSPLYTALLYEETEIAKMLLRREPTLKLRRHEQMNALRRCDDPELVDILLLTGSVAVDDWKGFLEQAVLYRNRESIKRLLSRMDTNGLAAVDPVIMMRAVVISGDYDKAYQQVTETHYDSETLFEAVLQSQRAKEYLAMVECLLRRRTTSPNDGFEIRAVAFAAENHDMHLLRCLMKYFGQGPFVAEFPVKGSISQWEHIRGGMQMHILSHAGGLGSEKDTVLKALLEVNVPAKEWHVEMWDSFSVETLNLSIAAGLDPNQANLLLPAVEENILVHVRILCEANANPNVMYVHQKGNFRGSRTAIQLAVESGSPEMVQMLLSDFGAGVDHPAGYYRGATCLQLAVGAGNIGMVRFLLHRGARVNAKRSLSYGRTAIEIAAGNRRLDVLKLLLLEGEHLFQTMAERYQFIRAAKIAEENGHGSILKMLKQHIDWNDDDQGLFEQIPVSSYLSIHIDEMTQKVSDSERSDNDFWCTLRHGCDRFPDDVHCLCEIEGIKNWTGEIPANHCCYYDDPESDLSSEGEASVHSSDSLATANNRGAVECDELISDYDQHSELVPVLDNTDDAMEYPEGFKVEPTREQAGTHFQALSTNPSLVWGQGQIALAPQALRYDRKIPVWLEMQDNAYDSVNDVAILEDSQHRPATRNLHPRSGMMLGEVPEFHIDDIGNDALALFNAEEFPGDEDTSQFFDWGCYDEEGTFREQELNILY
ncbi:hypothetical protein DHEL01_v207148 [Diaporthe helianthi]|uniref:Clr5 domain-containing protein n=1 Tax=Diaporthe helianthi TaxID=158607 RepID=A0A2P5HW53_DIAHE|nr:hypothetical protein DHEL01_v207148 [Diaporthe helianthi]